jgi:hypothetical protein
MQAGVDKWEAAGFLGMSVEILDRVYGHHHPDHLGLAARAIGYGRRRQSLAETLAGDRVRRAVPPQAIEKSGGGRSRSRTCLHSKFPANREKNRESRDFRLTWQVNASRAPIIQALFAPIPYSPEQGIFGIRTGKLKDHSGNFRCRL